MKISKELFIKGLAMGAISLGLAMGSAACGSDGGSGGTGNGLADSALGASQGAETEAALISLVDSGDFSIPASTKTAGDAAGGYAASVGDCASAEGEVVTITFPCDEFLPNIESGTLEVTFTGGSFPTVAFETTETLVGQFGVEITITTLATYVDSDEWDVSSDTEVVFGEASSTTDGQYDILVDDPCSTINGEVLVTLDAPELDASPVDVPFTGTYDEFSTCGDGTCPDGTFTLGVPSAFEISVEYDGTTTAVVSVSAVGGTDEEFEVELECEAR